MTRPIDRPITAKLASSDGILRTHRGGFLNGIGPVSLAVLAFAGLFKGNSALSWIPVDLTLLSVVVVALMVIVSRARDGRASGAIVAPIAVWVIFLFGVAGASLSGYSLTKVMTLFTITLLCAVAPFYLLRGSSQRLLFFKALILIGILTAVSALFVDPTAANDYSNRLTLDGSNTIGTAQMTAVAAIICLTFATRMRMTWFFRLLLIVGTAILFYVTLESGSRGPFIAAIVAVVALLVLAPGFKRYRGRVLILAAILGSAATWWAVRSSSDGATRILSFVAGDQDASSGNRQLLWAQAWAQITHNPFGIGWGNFTAFLGLDYPHNLFLEVLVEGGWFVGAAAVCYVLVAIVRSRRAALTPELMTMFSVLVFAVAEAMVSSDLNGDRLMWMAIGAAWAVSPVRSPLPGSASGPGTRVIGVSGVNG